MRFFKIFLISFFSLIGTIGIVLGVMYLTGYFKTTPVYPEQIAFSQERYLVEDDFSITITTATENVNQLEVELAFPSDPSQTGEYITDGNITIPRKVKINEPFKVTLNKTIQNLGTENLSWIVGGISTIEATSQNVKAKKISVDVYVDVPVHSLKVVSKLGIEDLESTTTFNVGSNFWLESDFVPVKSQFKFSQDGSDGREPVYKSVFYSTLSNDVNKTENKEIFAQQFNGLNTNESVNIKAQAFANSSTELNAYDSVKDYTDEGIKEENLMTLLENALITNKAVENSVNVEIADLVVGGFSVDTSNTIPSILNESIKVFANKENLQANEFSFNANIFATDNTTSLQSEVANLALGVYIESAAGFIPADLDYYNVVGAETINKEILGSSFVLYKPIINQSNINLSYWELAVLQEKINLKVFVVLLDSDNNILEYSFQEERPKYMVVVDSANEISMQIAWANPFEKTQQLYIYDAENDADKVYQQFDLKTLELLIPSSNTFKEVKYFAYLENSGTEKLDLADYVVTTGNKMSKEVSTGLTLDLYEIPNGILIPKDEKEFPLTATINVIFATVKTNLDGSYVYNNGQYIFDRISSVSVLGTVQSLKFEIIKTLKTFDAALNIDAVKNEEIYYDLVSKTMAFKQGAIGAFDVVISVPESKKDILIKEWNEGKISIQFETTPNQPNLLGYTTFDLGATDERLVAGEGKVNLFIPISISDIVYGAEETGSRHFSIKVNYERGNQTSLVKNIENYNVVAGETEYVDNETTPIDYLEVYDGKIATLTFDEKLNVINGQNEHYLSVATNLVKAKNGDSEIVTDGVYTASEESSFTIKYAGQVVKDWLYGENEQNVVNVIAKDKYGREIKDASLWNVVSSNEDIISINPLSKTMNFNKADNNTLVEISLASDNGMGGTTINGLFSIFIKVETSGRIAGIYTNAEGSTVGKIEQFKNFTKLDDENEFQLENKNYSQKNLTIQVDGSYNETINFYDANPLFQALYAMPQLESDNYELYDLKNVLKYSKADNIFGDNDEFLSFNYLKDEEGQDTSFLESIEIKKNFGKEGYLNLNVTSSVGFNITLNIVIKPTINATLQDYTVAGTQSLSDSGVDYIGVFAQKQITISFYRETQLSSTMEVTPLIFEKVIQPDGTYISKEITSSNKTQLSSLFTANKKGYTYSINFILDDVAGFINKELTFVLDSRKSINLNNSYKPLNYDFTQNIYVRVNPNVVVEINSNTTRPNFQVINDEININASSLSLPKIIGEKDSTDTILVYKRKVGDNAGLSLDSITNPTNYLYAYISDESGVEVSNLYFAITEDDGSLKIKLPLNGMQSTYISVAHYIDGNDYIVKTFKINVAVEIKAEENSNSFVNYNKVNYLQLKTGETYTYSELADFFASSAEASISVRFDEKYVNNKTFYDITAGTDIEIYDGTRILSDGLEIDVTISDSNNIVGTVKFPVIIMPKLAPLVTYSTEVDINGDDEKHIRNGIANADLKNLMSITYLVENDIFDSVEDGGKYDIRFKEGEKEYGIHIADEDTVLYSLRDGNGGFESINAVTIDPATGELTINSVGQDEYVIVVANVNGFEFYYRIKVKASLELQTYYPYYDNSDNSSEKAEYILFSKDEVSKTINLTSDFSLDIPATSQTGNWSAGEEEPSNIYNRFILVKNSVGSEKTLFTDVYNISDIIIKRISIGNISSNDRIEVDSRNFINYAFIEKYDDRTDLILKYNQRNYVVELEIITSNLATATYYVAVEQSERKFELVENKSVAEDISEYTLVEGAISIDAVDTGTTVDTLSNWYLRQSLGSAVTDQTSLLKYHIQDSQGMFSLNGKVINANYSVNDVNANLIAYTKYGELRKIPLILKSKIKIVDSENISEKTSDEIYSSRIYNLNDEIAFYENETKIDISWEKISFDGYKEGESPEFIETKFGPQENNIDPTFIVKPVNEEKFITLHCVAIINEQKFLFDYTLTILPGFSAMNPDSLNPENGGEVFATENKTIKISELFNVENITNINFYFNEEGKILGYIGESKDYCSQQFDLNINIMTGGNFCSVTGINQNELVLETESLAEFVNVLIEVKLNFGDNFSLTSYYSFTIKPEVNVTTNYPQPNGEILEYESLHVQATLNLNEKAEFQTKNRVVILNASDNSDFTPTNSNVYVTYEIVQGNVNISGGNGQENRFNFDSTFAFDFNNLPTDFAIIDFKVFVNDLARTIYTVKVLKNISEIYSIEINEINELNGNNEIFYVVEDRRDIFNGVQALRFTLSSSTSILVNQTLLGVYLLEDDAYTLITECSLMPADRGQTKTFKLASSENLDKLNLNNIRFKIDDSEYLTLFQMVSSNYPYFTLSSNGEIQFELVQRISVKYLGYKINDTQFLDNIKVAETYSDLYIEDGSKTSSSRESLKDFKLNYKYLGGANTERIDNLVSIYYGTSNDSSLGTYRYDLRVNINDDFDSQFLNIEANETIDHLLSNFGIKKYDGTDFVKFYNDNTYTVDDLIYNSNYYFDLELYKEDNTEKYFYFDETKPNGIGDSYDVNYSGYTSPLTFSRYMFKNSVNKDVIYDFEFSAAGAPNQGLIMPVTIYIYVSEDPGKNQYDPELDEESNCNNGCMKFAIERNVRIMPDWEMSFKNLSGTENTEDTPQVISSDMFGDNAMFQLTLFDPSSQSLLNAYHSNVENFINCAGNLLCEVSPSNEDFIEIQKLYQSWIASVTATEFAIRNFSIKFKDNYGYNKDFYFRVEPSELIYFTEFTGNVFFYENDTLIIGSTSADSDSANIADHGIVISKTLDESINVSLKLFKTDGTEIIDAISFADGKYILNYLDSSLFSTTTNTIRVYIQIELEKNDTYIIKTSQFELNKRYVTKFFNDNIRDNVAFNLVDYFEIYDLKQDQSVGKPILISDKTLIVNEDCTSVKIQVVSNGIKTVKTVENISSSDYILLSNYFPAISNIADCEFYSVKSFTSTSDEILLDYTENETDGIVGISNGPAKTDYVVELSNGLRYVAVELSTNENGTGKFEFEITNDDYKHMGIINYFVKETENQQFASIINEDNNQQFVVNKYVSGTSYTLVNTSNTTLESLPENLIISFKNNTEGVCIAEVNWQKEPFTNGNIFLPGTENGAIWTIKSKESDNFKFKFENDKKISIVTTKVEDEFININFTGYDKKIKVNLDKNELQEFSMLKEFGSINYELADKPISDNDLLKLRDMTYYNDTISIIVTPNENLSGGNNIQFKLIKGENEKYYDFNVPIKSFAYKTYIGINECFGEILSINKDYKLEAVGITGSNLPKSIKVIWPNGNSFEISGDKLADFVGQNKYGSMNITSMEELKISKDTITIDSVEHFETYEKNNLLDITKYYFIDYKNAKHMISANFKLSPYFHKIKLMTQSNEVSVTVYSKLEEDGITKYQADISSYGKYIALTDANGNFIRDDDGKILYLSDVAEQVRLIIDSTSETSGNAEIIDNTKIKTLENFDIDNEYISPSVQVVLNGDSKKDNWITIGSFKLSFNSYRALNLPLNKYNVFCLDNNNERLLVRTLEPRTSEQNSQEKVVVQAVSLFNDVGISVAGFTQSENLAQVYVPKNGKYRVMFPVSESEYIEFNASSSNIDGPYVVCGGVLSKASVTIKATSSIDADLPELNATWTNADNTFFGIKSINDFYWGDGELSAQYDIFECEDKNIYIAEAKIDLSAAFNNYKLKYNSSYESINKYFKAGKIITLELVGNDDNLKEVKVSGNESEKYLISEIVMTDSKIAKLSSKIYNPTDNKINLTGEIGHNLLYIKNISNDFDFTVPLFNMQGKYHLKISDMLNDSSSKNYKVDFFKEYNYSDVFFNTDLKVSDRANLLEKINQPMIEISFCDSYKYSCEEGDDRIHTIIKCNATGSEISEYSYYEGKISDTNSVDLAAESDDVMYIAYSQPKTSANEGKLIWHEYDLPLEKLPLKNLYFTLTNSEGTIAKVGDIPKLENGDKITDLWDGVFDISSLADVDYIYLTYQNDLKEPSDDQIIYINKNDLNVLNDYILNENTLLVGKLFTDDKGALIPKCKSLFIQPQESDENDIFQFVTNKAQNSIYKFTHNETKVCAKYTNNSLNMFTALGISIIYSDKVEVGVVTFKNLGWEKTETGYYAVNYEEADCFEIVEISTENTNIDCFELFGIAYFNLNSEINFSKLNFSISLSIDNSTIEGTVYSPDHPDQESIEVQISDGVNVFSYDYKLSGEDLNSGSFTINLKDNILNFCSIQLTVNYMGKEIHISLCSN